MKHLILALGLCCLTASAADQPAARRAGVERCFKVHRLLRSDSSHYWAEWSNTCPYTIDAVYVMVGFLDGSRKELGNGVWPMYFVQPGAHRVTRFSAPAAVEGFASVRLHRITTDSSYAFSEDREAVDAIRHATVPVGTVGDTAMGRVLPYGAPVPSGKTRY